MWGSLKRYIYNGVALKRKENLAEGCYNMDEPWRYDAK